METTVTLAELVRTFYKEDRQAIWVSYELSRQTYLDNIESKYKNIEREEMIQVCLISDGIKVRLGRIGQQVITAILVALASYHSNHCIVGSLHDPNAILFDKHDLSKAFLKPVHRSKLNPKMTWEDDYRALDAIIDLFIQAFGISDSMIPKEIAHFRKLLINPKGWTAYILNHFSLWDATRRRAFIYRMDDFRHDKSYLAQEEKACAALEAQYPHFNFTRYVPSTGVLNEVGTGIHQSFGGMYRFFRNTYHHKYLYEGENYNVEMLDRTLHTAFPFAFEEICIKFINAGIFNKFWG